MTVARLQLTISDYSHEAIFTLSNSLCLANLPLSQIVGGGGGMRRAVVAGAVVGTNDGKVWIDQKSTEGNNRS